jgi:hypothetical protein
MVIKNENIENLVKELEERAKELNCLYRIEDILSKHDISLPEAFTAIVKAIPPGWQFPDIASVKIVYNKAVYTTPEFEETGRVMSSDIVINDKIAGNISVYYLKPTPQFDEGPFLKEERKLLDTIAERLKHFIKHKDAYTLISDLEEIKDKSEGYTRHKWQVILDMLYKTDNPLFNTIIRKLLHNLCWMEIKEAEELLVRSSTGQRTTESFSEIDENKPIKKKSLDNEEFIRDVIQLTEKNLSDDEILSKLQKWIYEDKCSGLLKAVETTDTSLNDISDTLRRFYPLISNSELSASLEKGLMVSFLRRYFADQIEFIAIAKEFVELKDFYELIDRIILPAKSYGKLGGKSAGLFLATKIIAKKAGESEIAKNIKIPKTWYIPSDGIIHFMHYNDLEEVIEQKYKDIEAIRREYPHIVQIFKNSEFPAEFINGLSVALDDLGEKPLVVRSSSLLEDQFGSAFSGKYKSLFLANQGSKHDRLVALMDAISEVYASTFGPDPIEYRAERNLLDFHEEMGIMIQEVVGEKAGDYFMPSFAGVAFSNNEFRWSPRIKREDGLIRLVPGLGTRAVDRLSDDYPILVAPGQPNLRVNVSVEDKIKYTPGYIDVIDLKKNEFSTKKVDEVLRETGFSFPRVKELVSINKDNHITKPLGFNIDFEAGELLITFDGLIEDTTFIKQINLLLLVLSEGMKHPVDIEFASDKNDFYLLQCRAQSQSRENKPDTIPRDIPRSRIIFTANRYISNGKVPEISHIVYIDPKMYNEITTRDDLLAVGRAVGKLNKILPKRKFMLIGPGRWGSRGDIKLGVNVTYSDINNTTMLIEVARKIGNYTPDLSFGTHFFQDLVEASIRYLPLYPDEKGMVFNEAFFRKSENIFAQLAPEYGYLSDVVKVIDVDKCTGGQILKVLINGDFQEAVAFINEPSIQKPKDLSYGDYTDLQPSDHWQWRYNMAEKIASSIKEGDFGIKSIYIFGSSKNANAGPGSDIDLLVHIDDTKSEKDALLMWFDGWSKALAEMNFLKTGYKTDGLLDVHYITDNDIINKDSYASKINAVTDPAKKLKMRS